MNIKRILSPIIILLWSATALANSANAVNKDLTCVDCHEQQVNAWKDSHHYHAMAEIATPTNLGDFSSAPMVVDGDNVHFFKKEEQYFVTMPGLDGKPMTVEITHTFGYEPLQQYIFDVGNGKYQFIPYAWDSRTAEEGGQRWYNLYPGFEATNEFHWSQMGQNWNQNCADCHSTNFKKGFDVESLSYNSTYDAINVSCTACHQGTTEHLAWTKNQTSDAKHFGFSQSIATKHPIFYENDQGVLIPVDRAKETKQVEVCAQCHSRRAQISDHEENAAFFDHYIPATLTDALYHPDGQIYDEVYVYGSFTQSKMYQEGVTCINCHDPHTTKLKMPGNVTCTQCHSAPKYDTPKHHQHPVESEGAQCVNCHMPATRYMGVDDRRDHSFKVPRPDLSLTLDTPNACQNCHSDVSNREHAKQLEQWFPVSQYRSKSTFAHAFDQADKGSFAATPELVNIANDSQYTAQVRASAISRIQGARNNQELITFLAKQMESDDPIVVIEAIRATNQLSMINRALKVIPMLDHPVRSVRMTAGRALAANLADPTFQGERREKLQAAVDEYIEGQLYQADRGSSQTNLGQIYMLMREYDKAEAALRQSIRVEDIFMPAYIYLADLYRQQQNEAAAEQVLLDAIKVNPKASDIYYQLALVKVRQQDKAKAVGYFDLAIEHNDQNPRAYYTRGVLHQENGDTEKAKLDYAMAYKLQPQSPDYLYTLTVALIELKEYDSALFHAQKLGQLMPNNQQVQQLIQHIRSLM
ncbi:ammonia-forming cytochrome c nitrite reductase subunit c552 [Thalassotalea sp. LPB0316]|uniref:tetratricopeptide repeat protein n=1 Tax=Thalassotalea sp. LPB0316 TaxID=2769490 RepID=UPI001868ECD7|nr:multiheme c-type cytochrome [Thalassotalea sp. LPB0316]QOL25097.1 ammonia-forming cytochrome c nitrite reductase subunit c552 [Thalassotalea sp. LPB0316]